MDETEIIKVHVVKTDSNYVDTVKHAALAGVATVLATQALPALVKKLADNVKKRRDAKTDDPVDPTEPKE